MTHFNIWKNHKDKAQAYKWVTLQTLKKRIKTYNFYIRNATQKGTTKTEEEKKIQPRKNQLKTMLQ